MSTKYVTLFGALALAAVGCTGEFVSETGTPGDGTGDPAGADAGVDIPDPDPDPDTSTAQALFEQNVHDIITGTCNPGGACHSAQTPAFVSADQNAAYTKILGFKDQLFPGNSATGALVTNGNGTHYGASYSDGDLEAISAWLAQEEIEATAGGKISALAVWSGCMDLQDWEEENVAGNWANKNAQGQGNCEACHNLGADGFMASDQDERVFKYVTEDPAFMPSYFTLDATGTNVVINRARLEAVGNRLPPHEAHGGFDVDGNAMEALQDFYDKTKARLDAGNCGPPRFPQ